LERRKFIGYSAKALIVAFLMADDTQPKNNITPEHYVQVVHYEHYSEDYPEDYPDLKIGFLSDFHWGCSQMNAEKLAAIVQQANALGLDIITLGGDYLDQKEFGFFSWEPLSFNFDLKYLGKPCPKAEDIANILGDLKAKHGVYGVLGNHDWVVDGVGMRRELEKNGIIVLENKIAQIDVGTQQPIQILGLPDAVERAPLFADIPFNDLQPLPTIVLSHCPVGPNDINPMVAWQQNQQQMALVQFSGHTHGGQLVIGGYAPHLPPHSGPQHQKYGAFNVNKTHVIVSSGTGGSSNFPLSNVNPEIVVLHMGRPRPSHT
jgi:uncharacterized protein